MSDILWKAQPRNEEQSVFDVLPVWKIENILKEEEAIALKERVEREGFPVLTDERGTITHAHWGHIRSSDCPCSPTYTVKDGIDLYVHRLPL